MFLFSLKFCWLQRLLLNETMDVSSWNQCRPRFEDIVEMEQLKSHLRAGRHNFTSSRALVSCNYCFAAVLPKLPIIPANPDSNLTSLVLNLKGNSKYVARSSYCTRASRKHSIASYSKKILVLYKLVGTFSLSLEIKWRFNDKSNRLITQISARMHSKVFKLRTRRWLIILKQWKQFLSTLEKCRWHIRI